MSVWRLDQQEEVLAERVKTLFHLPSLPLYLPTSCLSCEVPLLHCCTLFLALTLPASLAQCQSLTHPCIYYLSLWCISVWWQDLEQKITRCKNKHPCVRIATGTTEVYDNGTYRCDKCFKDYPDNAERWHCAHCYDWDICYNCTCEHARERKHCEECGGSPPEAATASALAGFSLNIPEGWHVNDDFRMARNAVLGEDKVDFKAPVKPTRSATMHTHIEVFPYE